MIKKINNYQILSKIASGGMSEVYLADDTKTGKKVALKILDAKLSIDPDYLHRFKKEASICQQLDHKNIVKILSYGTFKENYYIAYEYIEGITLDKLIRQKDLTITEIENISIQILEGLSFAHSKNIIHRDIKPSNIMIEDGIVKILDFGIAKQELSATVTKTGLFMGSPHYVSPEQIEGHDIDYRSDIYSFGVVLYEMIEGKVPFSADTPWGIIRAHLDKNAPEITKDAPIYLKEVVIKCLSKTKENRFKSANEIISVIKNKEEIGSKTVIIDKIKGSRIFVAGGQSSTNEKIKEDVKRKRRGKIVAVEKRKGKGKIVAAVLVPILIIMVYFTIGLLFFGGAYKFYNEKDYLSAAYNFKVASYFLIPNAEYNSIYSLDSFSNYYIYDFLNKKYYEEAKFHLKELKIDFPDYTKIEEIENAYDIELKIYSAKEQSEKKNYDLALSFLEDALRINPNYVKTINLYDEITNKKELYKQFLDKVQNIKNSFNNGMLSESFNLIVGLISDDKNKEIITSNDLKNLNDLKNEIHDSGKNKIDSSSRNISLVAYSGTGTNYIKNIFEEDISQLTFDSYGNALAKETKSTSLGIKIGYSSYYDVAIIFYSTSNIIDSNTGISIFTRSLSENSK